MKFRPCTDIQRPGETDRGREPERPGRPGGREFCVRTGCCFYAGLYKKAGLKGGYVILLNGKGFLHYEATREQAVLALSGYPVGFRSAEVSVRKTRAEDLNAGASHDRNSYVFKNGVISWENLMKI